VTDHRSEGGRVEPASEGLEFGNVREEIDEYGMQVWACELPDPVREVFVDAQLNQREVGGGEGAAQPLDEIRTGAVLDCVVPEFGPRGSQLAEGGCPAATQRLNGERIPAFLQEDSLLIVLGEKAAKEAENLSGWVLLNGDERTDEENPAETGERHQSPPRFSGCCCEDDRDIWVALDLKQIASVVAANRKVDPRTSE